MKNADRVADAVGLYALKGKVNCVIVNRDADCLEPAEGTIAEAIEKEFKARVSKEVIAAVPAWETETWLMLFPECLKQYRGCWKQIPLRRPGGIENSKEHLTRALRSKARGCKDYEETDAPEIGKLIAGCPDLIGEREELSSSFSRFCAKLRSGSKQRR